MCATDPSAPVTAAIVRSANEARPTPCPVVGIGASAGGLEAFTELLSHLPAHTGLALVLVQHLDPTHESQLTELLAKATAVPVTEVTDGVAAQPDHVYVIPPNTNMVIIKGVLHLTPRSEIHGQHLPLDMFFRALAEDQQSRAIGVILSGTGSDGSLGLAEIKAVGGITFAQDEKSARFADMPLNAVNSGCVDFVLPPGQIAAELARVGEHPYLRPAAAPPEGEAATGGEAEGAFRKILARLRGSTGVDFSHYRGTTIRRRIARRMAVHRRDSLAEYLRFLEENPAEVEVLYRDILINVTSFFRDPEVFEALKAQVFPEIVKGKSPEAAIRIWVPGCSTGQEVYSLAMALLEFLDQGPMRPPIQIFGTDINDAVAIEKARVGLYPSNIEAEVTPARLQRFFTKEAAGYRIGKSIRDMCVFARQNVAADPPFSRLDLVSCRNVLIYLSGVLQKRIIPTFHYALNARGFLLLGTAETVGRFSDLFTVVDQKHSIFVKAPTLARTYPYFAAEDSHAKVAAVAGAVAERTATLADMQKEADRVALGRYAPAGVLINEDLEILQFRGRTAPYLEPAPGEASYDLLRMARQSLFVVLRSAIDEAKKQDVIVRRVAIPLREDPKARSIDLEVIPIHAPGAAQRCFLVLFEEAAAAAATAAPPEPMPPASAQEQEIVVLRQKLASSKEYQQAIIEQQSAANEELKSANEEILSSNEELQSTNEELQTSKEELQSTNEELRTVNDELQNRNLEVGHLNDDLTNTLASVKIPMVMFGLDLHIRRFTPAAAGVMNLIATDLGRPLGDLAPKIQVPELEKMLLEVIATVAPQEREVQDRQGHWYMMRLHPYRTMDQRIDGAVMALLDIDAAKQAEAKLRASEENFRLLATNAQDIIFRYEYLPTPHYSYISPSAATMTGYSIEEFYAQPDLMLRRIAHAEDRGRFEAIIQGKIPLPPVFVVRFVSKDGRIIWTEQRCKARFATDGALLSIEGIIRDITERKRSEEAQAFLAAIVESSDDAILSKGLDGTILTWNSAAQRLFGYEPQEIIGKPIALLLPPEGAQEEEQVLTQLQRNESHAHMETIRIAKDGRRIDVSVTISPLKDADGHVVGASTIAHDITQRKQTDAELKRAHLRLTETLESITDTFFSTDRDFTVTEINTAAERVLGRTRGELLGKHLWDCFPEARGSRFQSEYIRALSEGVAVHFEEYYPPLNVWFEVHAYPSAVGLAVYFHDITMRKFAEEQLQKSKAAAETANQAKDHFLAVLSHELRTPLTPVVATTALMLQDPRFDPDTRAQLAMISRNVELEARLIDDLLDITRIARGKIELHKRPVELREIIGRAVEVCQSDIEARKLKFDVDITGDAYMVLADVDRMQQVFWNLLRNAIKFTPMGGCMGIRCRGDGPDHVVAEVNDSGIGMVPEVMARIFNAFEQAERSITQRFGGLGLGLAISKTIVGLHGGTIEAESQGRNRGATFRIRLPLTREVAPSGSVRPASEREQAGPPLRILLVEDHGDTAQVMKRLLATQGHEVQAAADVATALRMATAGIFDLLLSDLGLPDGSGLDLMRSLRSQGSKLPGIALSGYGQEQDIQQSLEAGFAAHLTKPVNMLQLQNTIARVTSGKGG